MIVAVIAAVVALVAVLTRPDGGTAQNQGEVFLQAAGTTGQDPFTESTARESSPPPSPPSLASPDATETANVTPGVEGSSPGLYGGTRNVSSCDVEKQIAALDAAPEKKKAFATALGIEPSEVPDYLRSLTPVQLRVDTRVTSHGYRNGVATSYQAVLQAGTAVLVDDRGVPRVRCACGNPLLPPVAQKGTPDTTGDPWPAYRPSNVVVVTPAPRPVDAFVMVDPEKDDWFSRRPGDTGTHDRKTSRPTTAEPTPQGTEPTSPTEEPNPLAEEPAPTTDTASPSTDAPSPGTSSPESRSSEPLPSSESSELSESPTPPESGKPPKSPEPPGPSESSTPPDSRESANPPVSPKSLDATESSQPPDSGETPGSTQPPDEAGTPGATASPESPESLKSPESPESSESLESPGSSESSKSSDSPKPPDSKGSTDPPTSSEPQSPRSPRSPTTP
ncbi:DUF6777 domain-containing protein [Streptomyces sp. NPDC002896]|uniref:DUF6777 domain-containing protein n=1 Tax=Streptomyces sp. NPDC002896 TaxID=3154438 RepID=UPI00332F3B71